MPKKIKEDWEKWHAARTAFSARATEGFNTDLAALEAHIKNLQNIAPKDTAGWPVGTAMKVIDQLQRDYHRIKTLFDIVKS